MEDTEPELAIFYNHTVVELKTVNSLSYAVTEETQGQVKGLDFFSGSLD